MIANTLEYFGLLGRCSKEDAPELWQPQFRRHADILAYLEKLNLPKSIRILDLGCGTANLGRVLSKANFGTVSGADWRPETEVTYRSFLRDYWKIDLNSEDPYSKIGQKFDLIISSDVMEHLENPTDFLRKTKALAEPNGLVIITIPNAFNWIQRLQLFLTGNSSRYRTEEKGEYGHISLFTSHVFKSLVNRVGLRIVASSGGALFFSKYCLLPRMSFSPRWSYNLLYHLVPTQDFD